MKNKKMSCVKYASIYIVIIVVAALLSYRVFVIGGDIPLGENLCKSDWLGFWAGFLSFAGSVFLGMVALWQNKKANEMAELSEKRNQKNFKIIERQAKYKFVSEQIYLLGIEYCEILDEITKENSAANINKYLQIKVRLHALKSIKIDLIISKHYDKIPTVKMNKDLLKENIGKVCDSIDIVVDTIENGTVTEVEMPLSFELDALRNLQNYFDNQLYNEEETDDAEPITD